MSQRASGYARKPDEEYPTPSWVAGIIGDYLRKYGVRHIWEPAAGHIGLANALAQQGFYVTATHTDFLQAARPYGSAPWQQDIPGPIMSNPPGDHGRGVDAIVTNPPYGADKRGKLASDFIRHALTLHHIRFVAMLLRVDFDSAKTRVDIFRDNVHFAAKVVLLDRIKWFPGPNAPSDNHAWFVWDNMNAGSPPRMIYETKQARLDPRVIMAVADDRAVPADLRGGGDQVSAWTVDDPCHQADRA